MDIYVIGRPCFDIETFLEAMSNEGSYWNRSTDAKDAEWLIEVAGRICYFSFGDDQLTNSNEEFIRHLMKMGHESVIEHASWTFLVTGVTRALTHQLVRHRIGISFSQLSQQYHDETNARCIIPEQLKDYPDLQKIWNDSVNFSKEAYIKIKQDLEEAGEIKDEMNIRSVARSILPNATETKFVMTVNARELRHLIKLRGSKFCDKEMRCFVAVLLKKLKDESSVLFSDLVIGQLDDGSPYVKQDDIEN